MSDPASVGSEETGWPFSGVAGCFLAAGFFLLLALGGTEATGRLRKFFG